LELIMKYFTDKEFACRCCGKSEMNDRLLDALDKMRELCCFPFIISSGYRCPEYNNKVSSTGLTGPHTTGKAVDIVVSGKDAHKLLKYAYMYNFTGIGISQRGDHSKRFIHLDIIEGNTRPWIWSY